MKNILRTYWWAVAIIAVVPIILNFILQIPGFVKFVGKDTDWLAFWSNYLGGLIGALTSLFILFKTLQQNHNESEKNRKANDLANEINRKLQINVLKYQQQIQWLNAFREVSAKYLRIYNPNDIIIIANTLSSNPREAHTMMKPLFDRAMIYHTEFSYICKTDSYTKKLREMILQKYNEYNDVLYDIQSITSFKSNRNSPSFSQYVSHIQEKHIDISDSMKNIIKNASSLKKQDTFRTFVDVILKRVDDIKDDMNNIQSLLYDYIQKEQERINKILEE